MSNKFYHFISNFDFKYLFNAFLIFLVIYQLHDIGFAKLLQNIPTHPLFYLFFLGLFMSLPVSDFFIYRQLVPINFWEGQKFFIRKRFLNTSLLAYSGEVYIYNWVKSTFNIDKKRALKFIQNTNISSLFVSWINVYVFALYLFFFDKSDLFLNIYTDAKFIFYGFLFLFIGLLLFVVSRIKKEQFTEQITIFLIHFGRSAANVFFQTFQWFIIMPDAGFPVFISYMGIQFLISRLPALTNKDIIFVSLTIYLSNSTQVPVDIFSSALVVNLILNRLSGLILMLRK